MSFTRAPLRGNRTASSDVKAARFGNELHALSPTRDFARPGEIQADFDAFAMKAARPIQWLFRTKIVRFHAHAKAIKAAIELPPPGAHVTPRTSFRIRRFGRITCGGGVHEAALVNRSETQSQ